MPFIEIDTSRNEPKGSLVCGYGTVIKVDGKELKDVRAIDVRIGLDEAITVTTEVFATEELKLAAKADLHVNVLVTEGYQLVEREAEDGSRVYTAQLVQPEKQP